MSQDNFLVDLEPAAPVVAKTQEAPVGYITPKEAGNLLRLSPTTIRRLIATGMPYVRIGRNTIRIPIGKMNEWLENGKNFRTAQSVRSGKPFLPAATKVEAKPEPPPAKRRGRKPGRKPKEVKEEKHDTSILRRPDLDQR